MIRLRHLAALLLVALVAAGCGGDDSSGTDAGDTTDDTSSSDDSEPDDTTTPADDTPADDATGDDTAEPLDLTASFRGVTEDTIEVGIVAIDFERLADFGVDQNRGDVGAMMTATVSAINDRGGILGRMLEITTETYLPVGDVEADEICVRLTEDREVFIVVGAIRLDQVLCYTELHDTAVIAVGQQNQDRVDRANAPYVTVRSRVDTEAVDWVTAMTLAGVLEGRRVGVLGFVDADEELYQSTVAALRDAGIDPVEGLVPASGGDLTAIRSAQETVLERFRAEGVEVTVHASPIADGLETSAAIGYDTTWLQRPLLSPSTLTAQGLDVDYVDGMLSTAATDVATVDRPAMKDDPAVAECVSIIEEGTDELVDFAFEPEVDNLTSALNACGIATILELGLTAAGGDLTNESLAAAFDSLGEIELAGFSAAALGPDDHAAASAGGLARFSAAEGAWVRED